jgi:predicted TIM-barrel fold metal-dependent hydrolase
MRELFDAHVHVIDPRFPLIRNQGFLPAPFTTFDYRATMAGYEVVGGAVVAASFQGSDTAWLRSALDELGPNWFGVAQLDGATSDSTVRELDASGVRALRINLHRGDHADASAQFRLANRAWDIAGWHCELYVDCGRLGEFAVAIASLPCVVIDHLGLRAAGTDALLHLVAEGAKVKATGFGRLDLHVPTVLRQIAAIDPAALLFGSDLPSTRAPRPFDRSDVELIVQTLGESAARRALVDNGRALYAGRPRS